MASFRPPGYSILSSFIASRVFVSSTAELSAVFSSVCDSIDRRSMAGSGAVSFFSSSEEDVVDCVSDFEWPSCGSRPFSVSGPLAIEPVLLGTAVVVPDAAIKALSTLRIKREWDFRQ